MEPTRLIWRKATRSTTNGGACVEVATSHPGTIAIRDSKDPHGPVLTITSDEWVSFVAHVRATS